VSAFSRFDWLLRVDSASWVVLPHSSHPQFVEAPRPLSLRPTPAPHPRRPVPDFAATPQRFPETHAGQGPARFGSIRNGPATPVATQQRPDRGHHVAPRDRTRNIAATGNSLGHIGVAAWRIGRGILAATD